MSIEEGEGFLQKSGPLLGRECECCGRRYPKKGADAGLFGILFCSLFFGGTSKYCPSCRAEMKRSGLDTGDKCPLILRMFGFGIKEGTGWYQKSGVLFGRECASCGRRYPRMGLSGGFFGLLFCFLLFGGTSKYCPDCNAEMKKNGQKTDKSPLFRFIWFCVAILVLSLINRFFGH